MMAFLLSHKYLTGEEKLLLAEFLLGQQIYRWAIFPSFLMTYFSKLWVV